MKNLEPSVPFGGSPLSDNRHVCAFFHSDEEEYRVLLPFIKNGFDCGDRAVHIVNPHQRQEHLQRLVSAGIDTTAAEQSGQLKLQTSTEAYLRDGRFDKDRMFKVFEETACGDAKRDFPTNRIVCRMDWVAEGSQVDDVVEFESRVNDVWSRSPDTVICTYHLTKFGGDTVIDILRTHPLVILGGMLQQNPFFVPPAEFLREQRERRARRVAPPPPAG